MLRKRESLKVSARLSSFEESEDDCDLRATSKLETYTISYMEREVLNLTPWTELNRSAQILPTDRKMTQTLPTHGVLLDKSAEAVGYDTEDQETYCEVKYDHSGAEFEQSAYTRVMKILSLMVNYKNMIQWFAVDSPEGTEVIKITAHSQNVKMIVDSTYLKDKDYYLVLLKTFDDDYITEVWPINNLLHPQKITIRDKRFKDLNMKICVDLRHFAVWCETAFLLFDMNSTRLMGQYELPFYCTAFCFAPRNEAYLASDEGHFYNLKLKSGEMKLVNITSPFCNIPPSFLIFYSQTINAVLGNMVMKMNMFSPSTAAKYYFFDKKRDTADAEFIPMEPRMFAILLKKEQILFLFDVDKTIGPMYRWDFTDSEFVVSACWTKNTLFTLTRLGVVSRWKLLANGRKLREKHIDLKKEGCRQLITIDYDKFLIVSEQDASAIKWNS